MPLEEETSIGELSPETKEFFEEAAKPPKKTKEEPKPEQKKPEPKPEEKKLDPKASPEQKKLEPKPEEKKVESPKDAPDVERENLKKAVDEERTRRKEISEQLKGEARRREELEAKFNRFLSMVKESGEQPQVPEYEKDPAAHLKAREEALTKRQELLERAITERDAATNQERQLAHFRHTVASATQAFTKETPDYAEAYKFVRGIRERELEAMGVPEVNDDGARVRDAMLNQWELQLSHASLQFGKNPAAALYGQAQALGYKRADAVAAVAAAAAQDPATKLDALAKGSEAAKTLGSGGAAPSELSLERIMQMDEDEMAELVRGKGWNKAAKFFK